MHIHACFCMTLASPNSLANENSYYFWTLQPILPNHAALLFQATRYVTWNKPVPRAYVDQEKSLCSGPMGHKQRSSVAIFAGKRADQLRRG